MTNETDLEWARIAEETSADDAIPGEEMRARTMATNDLRDVAEAADQMAAAEARLREAVQIARANGRSWKRIAIPLGTSAQAARVRFSGTGTLAPKAAGAQAKHPFRPEAAGQRQLKRLGPTPGPSGWRLHD
jgi:hypothetical protein